LNKLIFCSKKIKTQTLNSSGYFATLLSRHGLPCEVSKESEPPTQQRVHVKERISGWTRLIPTRAGSSWGRERGLHGCSRSRMPREHVLHCSAVRTRSC